ncbi:MAG TPA: hypothetical protein VFF73_31500 [Planctomycetota bacterium]|nr:hypothetical protein [Planctomycetota bacterium]
MGLDLYAGTMTRYYSGEWLITTQRLLQGSGVSVGVHYASGTSPWLKAVEAAARVENFRRQLSERWGSKFPCFAEPPSWNEDSSTPYTTEKPDHDGVRSLVLVAAYLARPELTRPAVMPEKLDEDPAYGQASERGYYMGPMAVLEAHLFLPGDDNYIVVATDPLGSERFITSVGVLEMILKDLNAQTWNASPEILESWHRRGLVSWGPVQKVWKWGERPGKGEIVDERNDEADKIEVNAQYALACFTRVVEFARKHNVPIVVDQ